MEMKLSTKLYAGFFAITAAVMIVGSVAIYAFYNTERQLEESDAASTAMKSEIIPINNIIARMAADVVEVGFYMYGYSWSLCRALHKLDYVE
jgi:hypothetical protein